MTEFRRGDRVKGEFEGTFLRTMAATDTAAWINLGSGEVATFPTRRLALVEHWRPGDVVRDESGALFVRCASGHEDCWVFGGNPQAHSNGYGLKAQGRLTRLVEADDGR